MRRVVFVAVRLALMAAALAVARELLMDRSPERGLNGNRPLIGSLDTWPEVPRKP